MTADIVARFCGRRRFLFRVSPRKQGCFIVSAPRRLGQKGHSMADNGRYWASLIDRWLRQQKGQRSSFSKNSRLAPSGRSDFFERLSIMVYAV